MAMDAANLGKSLYNRLKSDMGLSDFGDEKLGNLKAFCTAITDEIISHITANAVVKSSTIKSSNIVVNGGTSGMAPYIGPVLNATGVLNDGSLTDGKIS